MENADKHAMVLDFSSDYSNELLELLCEKLVAENILYANIREKEYDEALKAIMQSEKPWIIMICCNKAEKECLEAIRQVRQTERITWLPILLLCNCASTEVTVQAYSLFVNAIIDIPENDGQKDRLKVMLDYWMDIAKFPKESERLEDDKGKKQ